VRRTVGTRERGAEQASKGRIDTRRKKGKCTTETREWVKLKECPGKLEENEKKGATGKPGVKQRKQQGRKSEGNETWWDKKVPKAVGTSVEGGNPTTVRKRGTKAK